MDRLMSDSDTMVKHIDEYIAKKQAKKKSQTLNKAKDPIELKKSKIVPDRAIELKTGYNLKSDTSGRHIDSQIREADRLIDQLFADIRQDRQEWLNDTFANNKPQIQRSRNTSQISDHTSKDICSLISGSNLSNY
jgi:hypothetical protein